MEIKDSLYYDDLKYYITKTANLSYLEDKNREFVIEQRMQMQENFKIDEITKRKIPYYTISSFQTDFFEFINYINEITGTCLENPYDLYIHKEIVKEKLDEFIENIKNKDLKFEDDNKAKQNNVIKKKSKIYLAFLF